MIVYHGSTKQIMQPDLKHSKQYLDFGRGFYLTSYKTQAEKWAKRKAIRTSAGAFVNVYEVDEKLDGLRILRFSEMDEKWLDFVCSCRQGEEIYRVYDVIIGNVADDDVFKTIDMYVRGIWDKEKALEELRYYKKNDQICFVSEKGLEKLSFKNVYEVVV